MEAEIRAERIAACKREIRSRADRGVERRMVTGLVEARATAAGWQIVGHGIVYNSISEDLGGWREIIMPAAPEKVLAGKPDIRGLLNHNPDLILGRTLARTMTVEDDAPAGVRYVIDPPDTSYANDLRVSLERGDITQSSFAFTVARGGSTWEDDPDDEDMLIRRVHNFSGLYDMSPVTYAAYPTTDVGPRTVTLEIEGDTAALGAALTAPTHERDGDEPSQAAHPDGVEEERQAGTSARDERAERLRLRIGEPPL